MKITIEATPEELVELTQQLKMQIQPITTVNTDEIGKITARLVQTISKERTSSNLGFFKNGA